MKSGLQEPAEIAAAFEKEYQGTNDVGPLVDKYFLGDFIGRFENERGGFPLAFLKSGIAPTINKTDRLRFYVLALNLYYLSSRYQSARRGSKRINSENQTDPRDFFPPETYKILSKDARLARFINPSSDEDVEISSNQELLSILPTLEKAVLSFQKHLAMHPPEQSRVYQENVARLRTNDSFFKEWVTICDKPCYGFPVNTQLVQLNIPFLQLAFIQENGKLELLSVAPYRK